MNWYYAVDGRQLGPLPEAEMESLVRDGTVGTDTLVWHDGMADWQPYGELQAASASGVSAVAETVACSVCGNRFPSDNVIRYENSWICASCKPAFFQRLKEGASQPGTLQYAGFWIRFAAKFVDGVILWVAGMAIAFPVGIVVGASAARTPRAVPGRFIAIQIVLMLLQYGLAALYATWFVGRFGATPGKMACRLKIVRSDATKVSYGRALGRHFSEYLSALILAVGYIMAGFDGEKRALHDRICDTRVVLNK